MSIFIEYIRYFYGCFQLQIWVIKLIKMRIVYYIYFYFHSFFFPFWNFKHSPVIISFLLRELLIIFQVHFAKIASLLILLHPTTALFPLYSWRIFSLDIVSLVDSSFLLLENYWATSSWPSWFQMRNLLSLNWCSYINNALFPSGCFQTFLSV